MRGSQLPAGPSTPTAVRTDGQLPPGAVIQGRLQLVAGAVPHPRTIPGDITVRDDADGNGQIVATTKTDSAGRFVIAVPAGTYTLTGTSPAFANGQLLCRNLAPVTIAGGHTASTVEVTCNGK